MAHDIRLFTVTSIYSIRKSTRNSQKLGNILPRRFKSQRERIRTSKTRTSSLRIRTSRLRKKKRDVQKKKFIDALCKCNIKTIVKEHASSENGRYCTFVPLFYVYDSGAEFHAD